MLVAHADAQVRLMPEAWEFAEQDTSEWNWLEQLSSLKIGAEFTFTEPEVRFEKGEIASDGSVGLRVVFVLNAAPPWVGSDSERGDSRRVPS